jgi:hypothetical protein
MRRARGNSAAKKVVAAALLKLADGVVWLTRNERPEGDKFSNTGIMSPSSSWAVECRLRR